MPVPAKQTGTLITAGRPPLFAVENAASPPNQSSYSASSGHGTMVDFTVFIAIASATALPMPSSVNG